MSTELQARTKQFALRVLKVAEALASSRSLVSRNLASQISRSGTSVAANYRAASRSRSKAEFISKMHVALEEADETEFWLELIADHGALPVEKLTDLHDEAHQITAIITASLKTVKGDR